MSFLKRIKAIGESKSHRANLLKEKVAADLVILISKAGLSRSDVAVKLDISEPALANLLRGDAKLGLDTINAICDAASVEFRDLNQSLSGVILKSK